jgi:uncharacterized YigZ family protein
MLKDYKTVLNATETLYVEKKSKFIANVSPISSESLAIEFLNDIKKIYKDASHNCFAYHVNQPSNITRMSDDGEPSGTAGSPILSVLDGYNLNNTIIIVTRYFGGTLLGTGGLIKSYTNSAKAGIDASIIVQKKLYKEFFVRCSYSLSGKIEYECILNNYFIEETRYSDEVEFTVLVEQLKCEFFDKHIIDLSSGSSVVLNGAWVFGMYVNGKVKREPIY